MKRLHQYKPKQINKKLFKKLQRRKKGFYHNFLNGTRGSIFAKDRNFSFCSWWRDKKFMQELDKAV